MQLFDSANVNLMADGGQLLSYSETITGRPGGRILENP
jgi:hypothetical protein